VSRILLNDGRVRGVLLASGEEISSPIVVSSADPRTTYLGLVGASDLPLKVVRRVKNIRFKGSTAKVNLALSGLPRFQGISGLDPLKGKIVFSPSIEYLEKAYDDAKYGRPSTHPALEGVIPTLLDPGLAPPGCHILSISVRYAPYRLSDESWDDEKDGLGDRVIETLSSLAPDLPGLVVDRQVLTPLDFERDYGLTEGSIYHGQMGIDQMLFMRPIPGYGRYRSPVAGLYLCGAGTHPGGGVTGLPGFNAAREIFADWRG
jgi:phytoene dehydrogenase-like protein